MPYNICLSLDPFDNYTHKTIQIKGTHPSLGLILQICKNRQIPQIIDCMKSTPAIRIPQWRTELKHGYIIAVNNIPVSTIDDIHQHIQHIREKGTQSVDIQIATLHKIAIYLQLGLPQLYHDQLNVIGKHLWDIKNNPA